MIKVKNYLLVIISFISIVTILYLFRWVFFVQSDISYLDNLYSFSQWSIPLSSRIMGDAYLYQHSGINLLKDFEPFSINPETPIFGKILLALSIKFFGNPHIFSIISLIILLITLNALAKRYFNFNNWNRKLLLLLVGTSPIIISQIPDTIMDLPHVALFLIHLYFLFHAVKSKKRYQIILDIFISGLSLGAMSATKIAVYLPIIYVIDLWYLWKNKKILYIIEIILISIAIYILIYYPYILKHGIIDWLKAQKWVLNFYLNSEVNAFKGMILITAFSGWYKGWWGEGWTRVPLWTGSWGIGIIATCIQLKNLLIKKNKISNEIKYLLFVSISLLGLLFFLPFWYRYFVFFVPMFWIILLNWNKNNIISLLLVLFPLINILVISSNSLKFGSDNFYSLWEKGSYQDMYEYFSNNLKVKISRNNYAEIQDRRLIENQVFSINVIDYNIFEKSFGSISESVTVIETSFDQVSKSNYVVIWKLNNSRWEIDSIKESSQNIENKIVSEDGYVCINPTKVSDWSDVYNQASKLLEISVAEASILTMKLVPKDYCIPLGTYDHKLQAKDLQLDPGVKLIDITNINAL